MSGGSRGIFISEQFYSEPWRFSVRFGRFLCCILI